MTEGKPIKLSNKVEERDYPFIWRACVDRRRVDYLKLPYEDRGKWPGLLYEIEVSSFLENLRKEGYDVIRKTKPHISDKAIRIEADLLERQKKEEA